MRSGVKLMPIGRLKAHEEVDEERVNEVKRDIERLGCIKNPVVVCKESLVILDGHHRVAALSRMGLKQVPVFLVDYFDFQVRVYLRRKELLGELIKEAIISRAKRGDKLPNKTTRHLIKNRIKNIHLRIENRRFCR
jgi:hypothetical protein